jgi:nucleotidyltransferase substrate binding protein (TIGR01987 family)
VSLDLTKLSNAIGRLGEALALYAQDPSQTIVRDGLIQRFEFTYEIAHKTLKRALEEFSASPEQYDKMTFPSLIRSGNEQDLLRSDWPRWQHYRGMRSKTSHAYDEAIALEVVADIAEFFDEAVFLRDRLVARAA